MASLFDFLHLLGPTIAALLTVPILQVIKHLVAALDDAPAVVKQLSAILIAYGLTELGTRFDELVIPTELSLFTGYDVEALISAAIAMAVHAGRKGRAPSYGGIASL